MKIPDNRRVAIVLGNVKSTFQSSEPLSVSSAGCHEQSSIWCTSKSKSREVHNLKQDKLSVMEYTSYFVELSRCSLECIAVDQMRMLTVEEDIVPYMRNQLVGQPVWTNHELYERVVEIEYVKNELRMTYPANPKKRVKWDTHWGWGTFEWKEQHATKNHRPSSY